MVTIIQKKHYDDNHTNETQEVGDYVYVKQLELCLKLAMKYSGSYQVI